MPQSDPSGYFCSIRQSNSSPGKKELSFTPPPTPVCFFKLISPGSGLRERIRDTDPISTPSPGSPAPYLGAAPRRGQGKKGPCLLAPSNPTRVPTTSPSDPASSSTLGILGSQSLTSSICHLQRLAPQKPLRPMVLGAGTRWERGSGVGGCHPGRGGLRAGSIRSIPGIGVGVSERGPGTGGNVAGWVFRREKVCRKQEARRAGQDRRPDGEDAPCVCACVRVCVCVCVCVSERESGGGGEREREKERNRLPPCQSRLDAGVPRPGRQILVASLLRGSAGVPREEPTRGARSGEVGDKERVEGGRVEGWGGGSGSTGERGGAPVTGF